MQNGNKFPITVKDYKGYMTKFPKQSMCENVKYNLENIKIGIGCFAAWKVDMIQ